MSNAVSDAAAGLPTGLTHITDVSVGGWIRPRFLPAVGHVGSVVPQGYAAYARILHRIDPTGARITWDRVCRFTGATPHALMQWHRVSIGWPDGNRTKSRSGRSSAIDPMDGSLDDGSLTALCELLACRTSGRAVCFALWNGWGWLYPAHEEQTMPAVYPPSVLDGPKLHLPGRDYVLLSGPLSAAGNLSGGTDRSSWVWQQSPNLIWPADQRWCVGTEIDFDSTVIGGDTELIDAVLADPALEAWPVGAEDSLRYDGDRIN